MAERPLTVGVVKETTAGERRVALVPEAVAALTGMGLGVAVEAGAGDGARYPDSDYTAAGAEIIGADGLPGCDIVVSVHRPAAQVLRELQAGAAVIGLLGILDDAALLRDLAVGKVTAIALDRLPRQLSRAQAMDALSSQSNVAGYKAAIVAAEAYDRYFPLLMTAAGVARPAQVLVLGAGVAGLQAIATARRLGAQVTGYDVRPEAREEVASLGAAVLELPSVSATGEGGYARELTPEERQAQDDALAEKAAGFDVVITTAQTPGRKPPLLLPAATVARLRPGAVVVDAAAGLLGGNVEGAPPGTCGYEAVTTDGGVTVIGAGNLPATVPRAASDAYARNVGALLKHLVRDERLAIDPDDEIAAAIAVTHDGQIRDAAVREAVDALETDSEEPQ